MKQFLLKLVLFFAILIAVDFGSGLVFAYLQSRAPYGNWQRFRYINDEMTDDVIIMGSSRASHHYIPQMIEDSLGMSCYNCGVDGNGILMFLANYRMISERYQPKVIVYDLSGFDIDLDDHTTYLGWLKPYCKRHCVGTIIDEIDSMEKYKLCSQLYQWNFKFIQLLTDNVAQFVRTEKGYKPMHGIINYIPGKDKKQLTDSEIEYQYDRLKMKFLEELMISCRNNGTELILAVSPFLFAVDSHKYEPAFLLAKKYDFLVFDKYADKNISCNNQYFKDPSHMNHKGAEKYTQSLILFLKNNKHSYK